MSGIEVARRVRATASLSRTVLIALSGYTHAQARCDAFEAGFDEHIAKPADCAVLLQLLGHGG
jgi:CheY-like chemotaxis protein